MSLTKEQFELKVKNREPIAIEDFPADIELNADNLNSLIKANVEMGNKSMLEEFKKGFHQTQRNLMFSGDEGSENQVGDSIIDTSFFHKSYMPGEMRVSKAGEPYVDGTGMANQLKVGRGPWLKLSPIMEKYATALKCRFNRDQMEMKGINLKEYNDEANAQYKALGMSEGVVADGGATVPVEYASTIIEFAIQQSRIVNSVWRYPMQTNSLYIPKLTQSAGSYFGGLTLYWIDEAESKTSTKPSMSRLSFTARKLIGLLYMTDELIADSALNIVNYMTGLFTRAFQYETERVILDGSGVAQPLGVINDPTINIVARAQENTIGHTDIINLEASLDENFTNLVFVTRRNTLATLRNLRDNNNALLYTVDYKTMMNDKTNQGNLLGYPLVLTRNVPSIGNQGDIILGDFSNYILAYRQDLKIDQSIHTAFTTDETAIRFVARMDGKPGVSIAFSVLDEMRS